MQNEEFLRDTLRHSFAQSLEQTTQSLKIILTAMSLPLPNRNSMMIGADGALMFLDDVGLVLRIERSDDLSFTRINNHPMIVQPLISRQISRNAILEICPGCLTTSVQADKDLLRRMLPQTGVHFHDSQLINTGLLPVKTPNFPKGVPVVIDRPAVETLTCRTAPIRDALEVFGLERDPQQRLYAHLKQALAAAWPQGQKAPSPVKMQAFFDLCRQKKRAGVLVAGWQRDPKTAWRGAADKREMAGDAGAAYARQINAFKAKTAIGHN